MPKFEFSNRKKSLKKILPFFVIGIAIVFLLAAITGVGEIFRAVSQIDKRIYLLAFIVQVSAITVWLVKWKILTKAAGLEVGTKRMFPILLSGIFVNTAIPSAKVGGEPLRAYMFSKIGEVPMDKSFASVAADRAVDGIPFVFILLVSLPVIVFAWNLPLYAVILLLVISIFVIIGIISFLYVCFRPKPARGLIKWLIRKLRRIISKFRPVKYVERKAESFMKDFGEGAKLIWGSKKHVASALALSSLYWFLSIFRMWLVFLALGQSVSFGTLGLALALGLILHMVPIPGGLGLVEGVYVLIFGAAGIPPGTAFTAAILDRGISFWFTSIFSASGIAWSGLKLSKSWES